MSDLPSEQLDPEAGTPPDSVFGNLPDSRPGGRSPRRDAAAKPPKKAGSAKASTKPKPTPTPASKPRPAAPPKAAAPPEPVAPEEDPRGALEEIAWAGVATVAEAATVGVRLLNKTLEALRGGSEKS